MTDIPPIIDIVVNASSRNTHPRVVAIRGGKKAMYDICDIDRWEYSQI
jgi:hypothetical protein